MTAVDLGPVSILLPTFNEEAVIHTRRQHAVGQGGFHSGKLVAPQDASLIVSTPSGTSVFSANAFRYVYDCGSRQSKRCREVAKIYAQSAPTRQLDLLFLSHFDDDHVNGVPDLLHSRDGVRVDTIVMPFVDDVERLVAFGRAQTRKAVIGRFFESLTIEPVRTLSAFNPRRILLIQRRPSDPDAEPIGIGPPAEGPDGSFQYKVRTDDPGGSHAQPRGARSQYGSIEVVTVYDDAVIDAGVPGAAFLWMFKPYVRPADPSRVLDFEREVETRLGWRWGTFRPRVEDPSVREGLVRDKVQAKILAEAYKAAFGKRNLTSLCLYSGPSAEPTARPRLMVKLHASHCEYVSKTGWLGTGDALLRKPQDVRAFLQHYLAQQASIATFGLPHHGAIANYSPTLVSMFTPANCVVSAKPPRNWRHPHPRVIADVVGQGAEAVHVTDADATAFDETFIIVI